MSLYALMNAKLSGDKTSCTLREIIKLRRGDGDVFELKTGNVILATVKPDDSITLNFHTAWRTSWEHMNPILAEQMEITKIDLATRPDVYRVNLKGDIWVLFGAHRPVMALPARMLRDAPPSEPRRTR